MNNMKFVKSMTLNAGDGVEVTHTSLTMFMHKHCKAMGHSSDIVYGAMLTLYIGGVDSGEVMPLAIYSDIYDENPVEVAYQSICTALSFCESLSPSINLMDDGNLVTTFSVENVLKEYE